MSLVELEHELMGSWMFGYAQALASAGIRTVFAFVTARVRELRRRVHEPTGAVIWYLPAPRSYLRLRVVGATRDLLPYLATPARDLTRVLRAEQCGAVICQEYECPRFDLAVVLGRSRGIPVFGSFHAGDRRSRVEPLLRPVTVRACAGLIISAAAEAARAQRAYGISSARIARIPNPIDEAVWRPGDCEIARAALGVPAAATVVVWHGAVYLDIKGLDVLLEAWASVTDARPDTDLRLVLVGGGADAPCLRRLIEHLGVRGVTFHDRWIHDRETLRLHLCAADLYALPSRSEGYPNAVLEAMAVGLPVVASEIAGVPDMVGRGSAAGGLLVPPGDARALTAALGRLIDDPTLRAALADQARRRVDARFSLDAVGAQLREFLLARGMRPPERQAVAA